MNHHSVGSTIVRDVCPHSRDSWAGTERRLRALALLGVDRDLTMTLASASQLLGTQILPVSQWEGRILLLSA